MCGRFVLTSPHQAMERLFDVTIGRDLPARYNLAPGQPILIVRRKERDGPSDPSPSDPSPSDLGPPERELAVVEWGLVPPWMKQRPTSRPMINARSETVADKPAFRAAYRRRRCLVPASGWYEWRSVGPGPKQPVFIHVPDAPLIAFAAIWERWHGPDGGNWLETVAIVTRPALPSLAPLHPRMPLVLHPGDYAPWLDPADPPPPDLIARLAGYPDQAFAWHPVSLRVNNVRHDDPMCVAPAEDLQGSLF